MTESSVSLSTNRHGVPMCDSISNGAARSSPRSIFLSFVLLKDAAWCASAFAKRFRREWDDSIELEDDASSSTSCFIVDDVPVFIRLIPAPIPDNEALGAAEDNFLWRGDKSLVAHHRAHLIVRLCPGKGPAGHLRRFVRRSQERLPLSASISMEWCISPKHTVILPNV